jgi:hypothetical protein
LPEWHSPKPKSCRRWIAPYYSWGVSTSSPAVDPSVTGFTKAMFLVSRALLTLPAQPWADETLDVFVFLFGWVQYGIREQCQLYH